MTQIDPARKGWFQLTGVVHHEVKAEEELKASTEADNGGTLPNALLPILKAPKP